MDACVLGEAHSSFLQQAAYLTGGVYVRPPKRGALVEYLLVRRRWLEAGGAAGEGLT